MQKVTTNYKFPLMLPMQLSKEVMFNEVVQKLDHLTNCVVNGFIEELNPNPLPHEKYILVKKGDENHNCICFYPNPASGWIYHKPEEHMMIFCRQANMFLIYSKDRWTQYNPSTEALNFVDKKVDSPFEEVGETFVCEEERVKFYLELTQDCEIDISNVIFDKISIVFMQKGVDPCNVTWKCDHKIVWATNIEYTGTFLPDQMDLVEFYQVVKPRVSFGRITSKTY
ncbi:hypothetical protein phytr_2480 [Candidatus Phycorickettsia trachydisci]|uniref:Uncharacterized protein n=1 Tax=Candidatus Phycorickettsia trachydisci TaxID=2115978 RepID=A0A2P1P7I8_9RICK|nr:hypothetical protein [Candidatus Phycorickettsia trachydisci]AVP87205.1 hypothetical protein phytr_2480 [Candidatus Phycorickettsia trachydisci]